MSWVTRAQATHLKGVYREKINVFKEFTLWEGTYELLGQGEKKCREFKTNKHLTQPYKNYLKKPRGVL